LRLQLANYCPADFVVLELIVDFVRIDLFRKIAHSLYNFKIYSYNRSALIVVSFGYVFIGKLNLEISYNRLK